MLRRLRAQEVRLGSPISKDPSQLCCRIFWDGESSLYGGKVEEIDDVDSPVRAVELADGTIVAVLKNDGGWRLSLQPPTNRSS